MIPDNLKCSTNCVIAGCSIEKGEVLSRDDLEELAKHARIFDDNHFVSTGRPAASSLLKIETDDGRWFSAKTRLGGELAADFAIKKAARKRALDEFKRVEQLGEVRFASGQNVERLVEEFRRYRRDVKGLPHAPTFRKYLMDKGYGAWLEPHQADSPAVESRASDQRTDTISDDAYRPLSVIIEMTGIPQNRAEAFKTRVRRWRKNSLQLRDGDCIEADSWEVRRPKFYYHMLALKELIEEYGGSCR